MTTQERTLFWQEQFAAWQASGLSAQAFCKHHSLSYHRFSYWRSKLETLQATPPATDALAGFAKVTMPAPDPLPTDSGLLLTLPNGIVISGLHASNICLLSDIIRRL